MSDFIITPDTIAQDRNNFTRYAGPSSWSNATIQTTNFVEYGEVRCNIPVKEFIYFGLTPDPTDPGFGGTEYSFSLSNTSARVNVGGSTKLVFSYNAGDEFKIIFNPDEVVWFRNSIEVYRMDITVSGPFVAWFSILRVGYSINSIVFTDTTPYTTQKGISRLAYQFYDTPILNAFLEAFIAEWDELRISEEKLLNLRELDSAEGVQLNGIGQIVGVDRPQGLSDSDYYLLIKTKIAINSTNMTVDSTLDIFQFIFNADQVSYQLPSNLSPIYTISGNITSIQSFVFDLLPSTLGVNVTYVATGPVEETFSFFNDPTGKGFGTTTDPELGGNFATIIT